MLATRSLPACPACFLEVACGLHDHLDEPYFGPSFDALDLDVMGMMATCMARGASTPERALAEVLPLRLISKRWCRAINRCTPLIAMLFPGLGPGCTFIEAAIDGARRGLARMAREFKRYGGIVYKRRETLAHNPGNPHPFYIQKSQELMDALTMRDMIQTEREQAKRFIDDARLRSTRKQQKRRRLAFQE